MNHLKSLNKVVFYVESNLKNKIDKTEIERLSTYSFVTFSRIFSILTGVSFYEYIRYRRLSESAKELRYSEIRVIDLALDYGYESVDAFSVAFKKFHSATPTEVRRGVSFKSYQPITFQISVQGGNQMDVRIEKREGINLVGKKMVAPIVDDFDQLRFSKLWTEFVGELEKYQLNDDLNYYGVCNILNEREMEYYAAVQSHILEGEEQFGLDEISIPTEEYAVFTVKGNIHESIGSAWKYIMGTFFQEEDYVMADTPDFEYYPSGNMFSNDYKMEICIPIIKK